MGDWAILALVAMGEVGLLVALGVISVTWSNRTTRRRLRQLATLLDSGTAEFNLDGLSADQQVRGCYQGHEVTLKRATVSVAGEQRLRFQPGFALERRTFRPHWAVILIWSVFAAIAVWAMVSGRGYSDAGFLLLLLLPGWSTLRRERRERGEPMPTPPVLAAAELRLRSFVPDAVAPDLANPAVTVAVTALVQDLRLPAVEVTSQATRGAGDVAAVRLVGVRWRRAEELRRALDGALVMLHALEQRRAAQAA